MSQTTNTVQNWMDNHHHQHHTHTSSLHHNHNHNQNVPPAVPLHQNQSQTQSHSSNSNKYKSTISVVPLASPSPPQSIHSTTSTSTDYHHPSPQTQTLPINSTTTTMTILPISITPPPRPSKKGEVRLNSMPWFHGKITRERAEELLIPREDGLFLVRESTNFPGDYTLCVVWNGRVEHYRVIYKDNQLTIDEEEFFENLAHLVEHYEKDADGLCTRLTKPLPKEGSQEYCVDAKAFIDAGWVISSKEIELQESLGKGEFGEVRLGLLRNTEQVAVKILKDSSKAAQAFLAEASLMTSLRHENLVKLLGVVFEGRNINLVTEYLSKGSLLEYLRSRGRLHVTKGDQINFAYDTCAGMEYLERRRVVHRDLAARNVLIAEDGTAKVADFGLAWREEGIMTSESTTGKLPIKWTAPEALKKNRFSNKSDMWSFGVLLWEIYSFGRVPYPRVTLSDVLSKVERGYIMDSPDGCPSQIYDLMKSSWKLNPDDRPSFADVRTNLSRLRYKFTTALT